MRYSRLYSLLLILMVFLGGCGQQSQQSNPIPEKIPDDFNFLIRFGTLSKNEINTFDGTITKDLISILPSPIQALQMENVESVQVIGGFQGVVGTYLNSEIEGKAVITKIINWIHEAKPIKAQTEYVKHGYPTEIAIIMNDGKRLSIEPGYHCVLQMNKGGGGTKTCPQDKGEVIVSMGSEPHIRLASPELFNWLKTEA